MVDSCKNMKKRIFLPVLALLALTAVSCGKERHCKCFNDNEGENQYLQVMVVDRAMKCEDITEMAFEEKYVTEDGTHSLHRIEVHNVTCRELND